MLKQFQEFIKQKCLFTKGDTILLTISGGVDSCVMLDLFSQIDISVAIAHCNFCLRGAESDKDEEFVRKLAQKYKIPIHVKYFDTKKESREKKISIQMAARDLRYQWFALLCSTNNYTHIATAHHQNDVLETSIFNLSKGTGIAGLHGILPKSGKIIRPILFALKSDIITYANENALEWRNDASNNENKYSRNLIRNEVVPLLKRINPNLEKTFEQNTEKLAAVEAIFNEQIELFIQKNISKQADKFILPIKVLETTKVPVMFLFEWVKKYNFNYFQAKEIIKSLGSQSGKVFYSADYQLVRERKELVLFPIDRKETKESYIQLSTKRLTVQDYYFEFKTFKKETDFEFSTSKILAHLDKNKLNFPLSIRTWQEGDEFFPLGMKGRKKKVSDFFINQKIPLHLKKEILILCSGRDIVWIIGYRLDERFKLSPKTETIFSISVSTQ